MIGTIALVVAGCGVGGDAGTTTPPVAKPDAVTAVSLTISNNTLQIGGTASLNANATKGDATAAVALDYSSSAPGIASVNSSGLVTAVSAGTATVTVTATGSGTCCTFSTRTATVSVTVSAPPPALSGTLTVGPNPVSVNVGAAVPLVPNPTRAAPSVAVVYQYLSSSTATATVDGNGVVTGVAPGQAVVTVTATGSGAGFASTVQTAVATITVQAGPPAIGELTVTVTPSSTVRVGTTARLIPVFSLAGASVTTTVVFLRPSDPAVIAVAADGTVTALAPGSSLVGISVTGSGSGFVTTTRTVMTGITVPALTPSLTGTMTISPPTAAIPVGALQELTANITRASPAVAVTYTVSSNSAPTVATATATATGVSIRAVAPGSTNITVQASGSGTGFSPTVQTAVATITVAAAAPFTLSSTAFRDGDTFPSQFACTAEFGRPVAGTNSSPPLTWDNAPQGTQSVAIVLEDLDSPGSPGRLFTHWITWGIAPVPPTLAAGSNGPFIGDNDLRGSGLSQTFIRNYFGACAPAGTGIHRYIFRAYALSAPLTLAAGANRAAFDAALAGKVLAEARITTTLNSNR